MTDKEKLEKIKALADKMYSRMAYLTSDTRPIRQAMDEYHQFIIHEYHKEEPVSDDFEAALAKEWKGYVDRGAATVDALEDNTQELAFAKGFYRGWNYPKSSVWHDANKEQPEIESAVAVWNPEIMNTENKLKIDDFTKALAECINQAQCAVVDPMAHAEIWKKELLELAKSEEPVSEDLEEAIEQYCVKHGYISIVDGYYTLQEQVSNIARHFANWQNQQMMAKAVDVEVKVDAGGYPYVDRVVELYDYEKDIPLAKKGDKYKLILIKED